MKRKLSLTFCSTLLAGSLICGAAVLPPEELLPADTLIMATVPDWDAFSDDNKQSPMVAFLKDPSMKPFVDKFKTAFNSNVIEPIERDLGIEIDDYTKLIHGQMTFAVVQNGWDGGRERVPAALVVLDAKEGAKDLETALASLRSKWTDSGKSLKTSTVRGVEFVEYQINGAELKTTLSRIFPMLDNVSNEDEEPPNLNLHVAQSGSLLLIGSEPQAFEKLLVRQSGGSVPALGRLPAYERDYNAMFREAGMYGWMHIRKFIEIAMDEIKNSPNKPAANPMMPIPAPDKIIEALGLADMRTLAFHAGQDSEGETGGFFIGVPEQDRKGLFKLMLADAKDSSPPPFIPEDAASFSRWRIDGKKAWSDFESMLNGLSPQIGVMMNFVLGNVGKDKDPNFDIKQAFFGNLGNDFISYAKNPRSAEPDDIAQPPSLGLVASPNPSEMAHALKMLASLSPLGGGAMKEREFLGRTIYTLGLPAQPTGDGSFKEMALHFAATGNYVAMSIDPATLEEYLRGGSVSRPLREKTGLAQAAQRVGGMNTGLFVYDNPTETMKAVFVMLRKDPDVFETMISSMATGMAGIEFWNAEKRKEWVDFSLLPPFEQVEKYFGYSVFAGRGVPAGIEFKVFAPTPAGMR